MNNCAERFAAAAAADVDNEQLLRAQNRRKKKIKYPITTHAKQKRNNINAKDANITLLMPTTDSVQTNVQNERFQVRVQCTQRTNIQMVSLRFQLVSNKMRSLTAYIM